MLAVAIGGCKKDKSNLSTCKIESVIYKSGNSVEGYSFEYNSNGQLSKVTFGDGFYVFAYSSTGVTASLYKADGTQRAAIEAQLNADGNFSRVYSRDLQSNTADTAVYGYNTDGYIISYLSVNGNDSTSAVYSYTGKNHTKTVSNNNGAITTYTYDFYTDLPNKTGLYEDFTLLLPFFGKRSENLFKTRTVTGNSTTIETYTYTLDANQYIKHIDCASSNPSQQDFYYACE